MEADALRRAIAAKEGVEDVQPLHLWQMDERRSSVEAHLVLEQGADFTEAVRWANARVAGEFGILHATFETDTRALGCAGPDCPARGG